MILSDKELKKGEKRNLWAMEVLNYCKHENIVFERWKEQRRTFFPICLDCQDENDEQTSLRLGIPIYDFVNELSAVRAIEDKITELGWYKPYKKNLKRIASTDPEMATSKERFEACYETWKEKNKNE